jgi:hypothetical protein
VPDLITKFGHLPYMVSELTIGKLYEVYAITYLGVKNFVGINNFTQYLLVNELRLPSFYPALLFKTECLHFHGQGWCLRHWGRESTHDLVFGYERLANDPKHLEQLILGNFEAYAIFDEWKKLVDEATNNANCPCKINISTTDIDYFNKRN